MKQNYKELLREQVKKLTDQAATIEDTDVAYLAGRLDAMLMAEQKRRADEKKETE